MAEPKDPGRWTLLTAHGRTLVAIAQNPRARVRDLAQVVGITERSAQQIVADLQAAGYVSRERVGRRNHYTVHLDRPFRHPAQNGLHVGPFLGLLAAADTNPMPPDAGDGHHATTLPDPPGPRESVEVAQQGDSDT